MNNESLFEGACSSDNDGIAMASSLEITSFPLFIPTITVLSAVFFGFLITKSRRLSKKEPILEERILRKKCFLQRVGASYGYANSPKGHIDTWRSKEFPLLIEPLSASSSTQATDGSKMVYLDYAGSALPTKSQLYAIFQSSYNHHILANPHSTGPAASQTLLLMEQATKRVMEHFNCEPGRFAGLKSNTTAANLHASDRHPGYDIVFTSGATEALRIVAERFPFSACNKSVSSKLIYVNNSHTSVVGMRGPAMANGAQFECKSMQEICIYSLIRSDEDDSNEGGDCQHQSLLVLNAECNFGGDRPANLASIVRRYRQNHIHTMIDFSKAASTGVVDLKESDPDFACLSFYKLFGEPTGLGALFVRRSAISTLMGNSNDDADKPRYFGGGSVDVILPSIDFKVPRQQPLASLTNGTVHFRGIVNLIHGFNELQSLGGMANIKSHSTCLASELAMRLRQLRHGNGKPAVIIYGAWSRNDANKGPTVAFNCLRSDGTFVGYNEVSKLAELHEPPMQLRTGCFCNPGACQEALDLKDEEIQDNYYTNGHVCGDHIDVVKGKPTGAIRASFGKDSLWEDMDCLATFLEKSFVNACTSESKATTNKSAPDAVRVGVAELYIFPIKSCAAQRVETWSLDNASGRLCFDREFALVDSSGTAMRLQRYPKMSQIRPRVDLQSMALIVSAPGCDDLVLNLVDEESDVKPNGVIQVCGNKCGGRLWGSYESSKWFSNYLGVQCWLARHDNNPLDGNPRSSHAAFANEESILLISQNAVDRLNLVLERQGQKHAQTKHFRPNIVVSSDGIEGAIAESGWKVVQHDGNKNLSFETAGDCARCSMVDVDPTTGMKGKTLRALADHNRRNGRITFGIFLRQTESWQRGLDHVIAEGDNLICK